MKSIRIGDLTWKVIGKAIEDGYDSVLFALGATEQHGPGLPEHTDTVQAEYIANKLALKLGKTLQAPTIHVGCSEHHLAFSGSISLRKETIQALIEDYVSSLVHHGFQKIIILPFHGGNFAPTAETIPLLREKYPSVKIVSYTDLKGFTAQLEQMVVNEGYGKEEIGGHADVWESSNMLFLDEERVSPKNFEEGYTGEIGQKEMEIIFSKGMTVFTANGILGDSRRAKKELGGSS